MKTENVNLLQSKFQVEAVESQDLRKNENLFSKMLIKKTMQDHEESLLLKHGTDVRWQEFACGWSAAFINIFITYPVNKVIFRQMIHGVKVYSAVQQLHSEGLYFLYRGVLPPLLQKSCSLSIMFGVYDEIKRPLIEKYKMNKYLAKTLGGMVAGCTEAILMPFERIQALLINSAYHTQYKNTYQAFIVIGRSYGFKEYYRGLTPILLRNGPSNVCFFILREEIQVRYPQRQTPLQQMLFNFFTGACIGALLSSAYYPLNVLKIKMQSKVGGEYENMFRVLIGLYRERGSKISNLYLGVNMNVTRAFLSWGVMSTAYEFIKKFVY